jgi:cytochrome c553
MNDRDPSDPLTGAERAALIAWVEAPVVDDFADRVMDAWQREQRGASPSRTANRGAPAGRWRWATTTLVAAAAALLLVVWLRPVPSAETMAAADAARPALLAHCAPCHDADSSDAVAAALDVFDARRDDWWVDLDDDQLVAMLARSDTTEMSAAARTAIADFVAHARR